MSSQLVAIIRQQQPRQINRTLIVVRNSHTGILLD
jgi:hypothetical protein